MKYEQVVAIMHHPVLPTWSVLLTDKLYEHELDGIERLFIALVRTGSALRLRHGHHLQHVDGTGPMAGPVGLQHGLGQITEDGEQAAAADLPVKGWRRGVNICVEIRRNPGGNNNLKGHLS